MNEPEDRRSWYVLQVRTGREKVVAQHLECRGYEHFLPLWNLPKRSARQNCAKPLFPGYIFCLIDLSDRVSPATLTPGVLSIVAFGGIPAVVPVQEIAGLQRIVTSGENYEPCAMHEIGTWVTVREGMFKGLRGRISQVRSRGRLVFNIESIQKGVAIEVDLWSVERFEPDELQSVVNPHPGRLFSTRAETISARA